jgi:hypothetical protein
MRRKKAVRLLLISVLTVASFACGTTTSFQSTWKSPTAQPLHLKGRKVVAVFVSRDPSLRRRAEDAMAREIMARGAEGVAAYTFLSDQEIHDRDAAKAKAESLGFAGAVVMRVVGSETVYGRRPAGAIWVGPQYGRFWGGYWGWGWGTVWEPAYLTVDKIVKVETLVYSLERDELVWAGVSRTFDPIGINDFIAELATAVSERMEKDGLIKRD